MKKIVNIAVFFSCLFYSCTIDVEKTGLPAETEGYVPIYASSASAKKIFTEPPRATVNGGKIYTTGNLLFQVERDSGIHVINYADPANPKKLGFIHSFLCKELSAKNGFIYTNNLSDLVVIDINNMNNVREVSRTENVFPDLALQFPSKSNQSETIYFECPDPKKGVITGWERKQIKNPKCWR